MKLGSSKYLIILGTAFIIVALAFVSGNIEEIKPQITLATSAIPQNYTELYFENHSKLPVKIYKDRTYPISYTINNLENSDKSYKISTYTLSGDNKVVLNEKTINIKNGEQLTFQENIGPLPLEGRIKIVIELVGMNQSISFWMDK